MISPAAISSAAFLVTVGELIVTATVFANVAASISPRMGIGIDSRNMIS
jgi:hypothetical protein